MYARPSRRYERMCVPRSRAFASWSRLTPYGQARTASIRNTATADLQGGTDPAPFRDPCARLAAASARRTQTLRVRRPHRIPAHAPVGGASRKRGTGARDSSHLPRRPGTGCIPRRRHWFVRWGPSLRARTAAGHVEDEENPGDRRASTGRARAAGRSQRCDLRSDRATRPVLRSRSLQSDRLLDRRQRRRKFRRRALPEIRAHGAQHPQGAVRHHRRANCSRSARKGSIRPVTICWR